MWLHGLGAVVGKAKVAAPRPEAEAKAAVEPTGEAEEVAAEEEDLSKGPTAVDSSNEDTGVAGA